MGKYFGTDGIRFIFTKEIKTLIYKIGNAINCFKASRIIIGTDTRESSKEILSYLLSTLEGNISYVGVLSTPAIAYLSKEYKCLGIVITASHNPYQYNGIKVFNKGNKLSEEEIKSFEELIYKEVIIKTNSIQLKVDKDLINRYSEYLSSLINNKLDFPIAFDLANGALSSNKDIFYKLTNHPLFINDSPNGININLSSGSLYPEVIQKYIINNNIKYGFCYDGDGDRIILVSKDHIFDGNEILYLLLKYYKDNKAVITTFTDLSYEELLLRNNIHPFYCSSGDINVLNEMLSKDIYLGGEASGHIINRHISNIGDALINTIIICGLLNQSFIEELLSSYTPYYNEMINIEAKDKEIINDNKVNSLITKLLLDNSKLRIVLRKSGTEDKIRLFISSKELNSLLKAKREIVSLLKLLIYKVDFDNYQNIIIDKDTIIEKNVTIKGLCTITNSKIDEGATIESSSITNSIIGKNCSIGPYSHLRTGTILGENVKIGNFVEIKNSTIGDNSKVSHLTYLGDCIIGKRVNIGCGVVSVNYNGKIKQSSSIGDGSFIGCNVNLIAPLNIGDNVYIAAGSTITKDIPSNAFSISRNEQHIKENGSIKYLFRSEE